MVKKGRKLRYFQLSKIRIGVLVDFGYIYSICGIENHFGSYKMCLGLFFLFMVLFWSHFGPRNREEQAIYCCESHKTRK